MRILLTTHLPLDKSASGLAAALAAIGHEIGCLVVTGTAGGDRDAAAGVEVEEVIAATGFPRADLPFDLPQFRRAADSALTFDALTDSQLNQYRDTLRDRLDRVIVRFDPQVIHCTQLWLWAHLALESGAPYVVSVAGPELHLYHHDLRYQGFVQQAVENAGRVLVEGRPLQDEMLGTFADIADRLELIPPLNESSQAADQTNPVLARYVAIYQEVLARRFGSEGQ